MTFLSSDDITFPDPDTATDEGLLAVGGDLSPPRLLDAYRHGVFPWYEESSPILWWSPDPRLVLFPSEFRMSQSLKKSLKKSWTLTIDTCFRNVVNACATESKRDQNTWITNDMQQAYGQLHDLGYAHSFEVWLENELAGGLYGISLGRAFFGESMFHVKRDASKIALYYLCETLQQWQFDFIDCQLPTPHLLRLGAKIIPRHEFLQRLAATLQHPDKLGVWEKT